MEFRNSIYAAPILHENAGTPALAAVNTSMSALTLLYEEFNVGQIRAN